MQHIALKLLLGRPRSTGRRGHDRLPIIVLTGVAIDLAVWAPRRSAIDARPEPAVLQRGDYLGLIAASVAVDEQTAIGSISER